ncbi:MAG: hypothetical protein ACLFWB_13155, partial [Armatimonadota bacterium]
LPAVLQSVQAEIRKACNVEIWSVDGKNPTGVAPVSLCVGTIGARHVAVGKFVLDAVRIH